ncbi:hypothetical protein FOZ62_004950, partial [Perkinsus olseni]
MSGDSEGSTPSLRETGTNTGVDFPAIPAIGSGGTGTDPPRTSSSANGSNYPEYSSVNGNPGLPRTPAVGLISHHVCEKFKGSVDQDIQEWFETFEMATSACGWNDVQR